MRPGTSARALRNGAQLWALDMAVDAAGEPSTDRASVDLALALAAAWPLPEPGHRRIHRCRAAAMAPAVCGAMGGRAGRARVFTLSALSFPAGTGTAV